MTVISQPASDAFLMDVQVSEPRRGRVLAVDSSSATLSPWPSEGIHPLGTQIRTWIQEQYEEGEPKFEFVYEDSPFQV